MNIKKIKIGQIFDLLDKNYGFVFRGILLKNNRIWIWKHKFNAFNNTFCSLEEFLKYKSLEVKVVSK